MVVVNIPFRRLEALPIIPASHVVSHVLNYQVSGMAPNELQVYAQYRLPREHSGQKSSCPCRRCRRRGFDSWVGKIPWKRNWQPTPAFLLGEFQGMRSLVGCSPWDCKRVGHDGACVCVRAHTQTHTIHLSSSFFWRLLKRKNGG